MKRAVVIPLLAIVESLFFRSTSAFAGYILGMTGEWLYLFIAVGYLIKNIWWVYSEYLKSDAAAEAYIRKRLPSVHRVIMMDPAARPFLFAGVRLSTTISPLIPPFLYPTLGYAAAFQRCETVAFATIIILMIGRVAELVLEVNSAE